MGAELGLVVGSGLVAGVTGLGMAAIPWRGREIVRLKWAFLALGARLWALRPRLRPVQVGVFEAQPALSK